MPLDHGYAVLRAALHGYERDDEVNDPGRWYHVTLDVRVGQTKYKAAIDIDSKNSDVGVEWRTVLVPAAELGTVDSLAPGLHTLASNATSGALDYYRSPAFFANPPGCVFVKQPTGLLADAIRFLQKLQREQRQWHQGSWLEATLALEAVLGTGDDVLVWGEPFTTGLGLHNIHQNQGDPLSSQWAAANGIWQDGATAVRQPSGAWLFFLNKFSSQAFETDENGDSALS